jgi:hypothetical protein
LGTITDVYERIRDNKSCWEIIKFDQELLIKDFHNIRDSTYRFDKTKIDYYQAG